MTGPDLEAQVQDLREQVRELDALLKAAARGLGQDNDALGEGLLRLAERVGQLDGFQPDGSAGPGTDTADGDGSAPAAESGDNPDAPGEPQQDPPPQAWVDYATAEEWRELGAWVDWLHATYDFRANTGVPACWPAHLGVVEELAALHASWRHAADEAQPVEKDVDGMRYRGAQADTSALIYFHDRWLHPLLTRVMVLYRIGDCRQGHKPSGKGAPGASKGSATDPELLQGAIDLRARVRAPHTPASTKRAGAKRVAAQRGSAQPSELEQVDDLDAEPPFDPESDPPFDPETGEVLD